MKFYMTERRNLKKSDWSRINAGTFRVSEGMHIYLITNKINSRQYVGRTTRADPRRRWSEHKKDGRKTGKCIISNALRKYGADAFTFEVIETLTDPHVLAEREAFWIGHYNTLSPNGYNLETYQPHVVLSDEARANRSRTNQGKPKSKTKTSPYLGVLRREQRYVMEIGKSNIAYTQSFRTEEEAARSYDMMALYLYGPSAKTNFGASAYQQQAIEEMYRLVITSDKTSRYKGVDYVTSRERWRTVVRLSTKPRSTWVKGFEDEIEAAEAYDKAQIHLCGAKAEDLNFPERYETYLAQDLSAFCYRRPKSSAYWGVYFRKGNETYRARFKHNGKTYNCGDYHTDIEAHRAVQNRLKEIGVTR